MATISEVDLYLKEFKYKLDFGELLFRNERNKNTETLVRLEFTIQHVKQILRMLSVEDYSEGPLLESMGVNFNIDMWVFGKTIKGLEIYIKISLGKFNNNVICISFHIAEYPMIYPFKD